MSAIIGTWKMSLVSVKASALLLENGIAAGDAVEQAVMGVEDVREKRVTLWEKLQ